jgi:hypothetical protein
MVGTKKISAHRRDVELEIAECRNVEKLLLLPAHPTLTEAILFFTLFLHNMFQP